MSSSKTKQSGEKKGTIAESVKATAAEASTNDQPLPLNDFETQEMEGYEHKQQTGVTLSEVENNRYQELKARAA